MWDTLNTDVLRLAYLVRLRERERNTAEVDRLMSINRAITAIEHRIAATVAAQMDIDRLDETKMVFEGLDYVLEKDATP